MKVGESGVQEAPLSLSLRPHYSPEPDLEPNSKSEGPGGRGVPSKGTERGRQDLTGHLTASSMELSYTHVDCTICFQGCFWVRVLLLPRTFLLLIHHIVILSAYLLPVLWVTQINIS